MQSLKTIGQKIQLPGYVVSNFIHPGSQIQPAIPPLHQNTNSNGKHITSIKHSAKNFEVIDTIRFIAMCSIVWGHCNLGAEDAIYSTTSGIMLQSLVLQMGRIGTIVFFLISGFLIESKIQTYTPIGFLKSRFKSTILPWLTFVTIFTFLNLVNNTSLKTAINQGSLIRVLLINAEVAKNSVFYFAYWFIVVFVISAVVLIMFKKYNNSMWMGFILALITVFYCINLHYGWISAHHTKAFLGYAFFMWLGVQLSRHYQKFINLLNSITWPVFIGGFVLSLVFACLEGFHLSRSGCVDPYASIRLSNIVNSLIAFGCLFKLGKINLINNLKPRKLVYGIYLIHSVLVYEAISFYTRYFSNRYVAQSSGTLFVIEIVAFVAVLTLSIVLVNAFSGKYTAAFYLAIDSLSDKTRQLVTQIMFILNPINYIDKLSVQGSYQASRFVLLIMLPCLSCFYFLSRFFV